MGRRQMSSMNPGQTATRPSQGRAELATEHGRTSIADNVVQKIVGMAAREVSGVYQLGSGAARAMGAIRERVPGSGGPSRTQGVTGAVGEKQAAVDLDGGAEHGVTIAAP